MDRGLARTSPEEPRLGGPGATHYTLTTMATSALAGRISAYVPTGPTGASQPVISPYFGDVDTRNPTSGVVHWQTNTANQLVVTWDQVGYYDSHADLLNSFQLILRNNDYAIPTGEDAIGFFYDTMGWEQTDTSQVAAVGFGDGAGNGEALQSSLEPGSRVVTEI
jgi:hypothetical protein